MMLAAKIGAVIYFIGFLFILWVNLASGPVTVGLSLCRAAVWPWFIATGKPEGERASMD